MPKQVCVIGGGASGICAVKSLVEEGLNPICYESRKDVGGLWNYSNNESPESNRVYDSLITNISKEASCFSDFPFPEDYPPYMSAAQCHSYLKSYIHHFHLEKYFQVCKQVVSVVEQNVEEDVGNRWKVTVKDTETNELTVECFSCILICTGTYSKPIWPQYDGLNSKEFKGRIMHAREFRSPNEFEGLNVLVVGLGSSGADIAADVSRVCNKTILSTRSGGYMLPRIYKNGLPPDMIITKRISAIARDFVPIGLANWAARKLIYRGFDHKTLGIESKYPPMSPVASYLINDDLAYRIFCGKVVIKPDVVKAMAKEVYFEDGSKEKFDVVIFATGYSPDFSFMSDLILPDELADMKLFEWMFPFNISDPASLAVVGLLPSTGGAAIPRFECQTRYIAQVMSGLNSLPPVEEMRKAFEKDRINYTRFAHLGRPFVFRKQIGFKYPDRIATMAGFYPSFWRLLFQDPRLAIAVYFGPFLPYHYRIFGRHSKRELARERTLHALQNSLSAISRSDN